MFAVSCENIEPNDGLDTSIEENEILIYAAGADATRAYVSEVGASTGDPSTIVWDEGDQVGVYVSGPATETNRCFTSLAGAGVASATFKGSFENKATTGNFTYYAYSPYTATAGADHTAVAGYLNPTQVQVDSKGTHIGEQMLEIATPVNSDNNKGNIDMKFRNKFAILNFKIKYSDENNDGQTLKGAQVTGIRVYVANPRGGEDEPFVPLNSYDYALAGKYTANLQTQTTTMNKTAYSWLVELVVGHKVTVESKDNNGAVDAWVVVNPVADMTNKKLVAEIITDRGTFVTSRSIKSEKLAENTVYVMPATIKVPKVTPKVYPLWTEESKPNSFFNVLQINETHTITGADSAIELKPSNCFVVKPNTLYKFKANVRGRGAAGVAAMGITENGFVGDYYMHADGTITTLLENDDYIYVKTSEEGNAVISLYYGGTVLWSWHIWSINDELTDVQVADNVYMLDRNLGARKVLTTSYVDNGGNYHAATAGLFYCWGFNVPYPGVYGYLMTRSSQYSASAINKFLNNYYYEGNSATLVTTRYILPALTLSTSIMAPYAPADLASNTDINAATDQYLRMWGYSSDGNYKKTAFDPCPYGYMVPKQEIFGQYNIDQTNGFNVNESGIEPILYKSQVQSLRYNGSVATYLPEMGLIGLYNTDASVNNWRHQGQGSAYYWTATPAEVSKNGGVMTSASYNPDTNAFGSTYSNEENNRRAMVQYITSTTSSVKHFHYAISRFQGCPVRCVRCEDEQ